MNRYGKSRLASYAVGVGIAFALVFVSSTLAAQQTSQHIVEKQKWRIAKYRDTGSIKGEKPRLLEADKIANISFAKGRIDGSPTCGVFNGTYGFSGDQLWVQADIILNGFCPTEEMSQTTQILDDFKGFLRVKEKDDSVVLSDQRGKVRLVLVRY
jgi:heat shock protein HslJ